MGFDSLLATEIRGWFMKTLQMNIPVLKILSGSTVGELLMIATDTLPPTYVPDLKDGNTISDRPEYMVTSNTTNTWPSAKRILDSPSPIPDNSKPSSDSGREAAISGLSSNMSETKSSTAPSEQISNSDYEVIKHEEIREPDFLQESKLSFSQAIFWFVRSFHEDKSSLNHTASFKLTGTIHNEGFEYALCQIGQQHSILRACFFDQDGIPLQRILAKSTIRGEYRYIHDELEVTQVVNELQISQL
jgi:hybrid polyketide synthase / nonribosomal peptide synthetase ACE1